MNERSCWWVQRPNGEPDEETVQDYEYLKFRLADEWWSINSRDQLILPIVPLERLTSEAGVQDVTGDPGLLAQYGGAKLGMSMLGSGNEPSQGTEWYVEYDPRSGFDIVHTSDWSAPFPWVETELEVDDG